MDRLGEDFDQNCGINQNNLQRLVNQKVWRAKAGQFERKTAHLAASQRFGPQFEAWLAQSQLGAMKRADAVRMMKQMRKEGVMKIADAYWILGRAKTFIAKMQANKEYRQGDEPLIMEGFSMDSNA